MAARTRPRPAGSSLFRRSLGIFLPAALALALLFSLAAFVGMDRLYGELMEDSLGAAAAGLAAVLDESPPGDQAAWADAAGEASGLRVTLVLPDGSVAADSLASPPDMDNHGSRPEIAEALRGGEGFARRRSSTLDRELFYAAVPLRDPEGRASGALRVAIDLPGLAGRLAPLRSALAAAFVAIAALAALSAWAFSRGVAAPLSRLAEAARRIGSGGAEASAFHRSAAAEGPEELRILGGALESMAAELENRAKEEAIAGGEVEAILDSLEEAVLALDGSGRLRRANRAASALFGISAATLDGRPRLLEAVRFTALAEIAAECGASAAPVERVLALEFPGGERWFRALATPLGGAAGEASVVMVLSDITRLRRLERIRRDFVANVSHELRTPIQLVKGFAESLREGALDEPELAARYVGIIERNAARMESLVGDLLALARLEQEEGRLERSLVGVRTLLEEAREAIAPKAAEKGATIEIEAPAELEARVNAGLVVQALVNLLDNAVKYGPAGGKVRASARVLGEAGDLLLEVADEGPGIPARDLPRVFERFYRVDASRSRELGGTGLGLSIVRHIALAHGGEASVESWEGEGSRFRLRIPPVQAD